MQHSVIRIRQEYDKQLCCMWPMETPIYLYCCIYAKCKIHGRRLEIVYSNIVMLIKRC